MAKVGMKYFDGVGKLLVGLGDRSHLTRRPYHVGDELHMNSMSRRLRSTVTLEMGGREVEISGQSWYEVF